MATYDANREIGTDDTSRLRKSAIPGADNFATGQVTLSTSAALVKAANAARRALIVKNIDASIVVYIGVTGVTSANGMELDAGESISVNTNDAVYAVAASGTPKVAYWEEYD